MAGKKQQQQTSGDSRLDYLHKIGLKDATAADLELPNVRKLVHTSHNPGEFIGNDVHPGFDYYRATSQRDVDSCKQVGYLALPSSADVRMRAGSTDKETIMARPKEVTAAHRLADHERREAKRSGHFQHATPLSTDTQLTESITRTVGKSPVAYSQE
jgi:hypothetical protein